MTEDSFYDIVARATSKELVTEDWGRIFDVIDEINRNPDDGPEAVVTAIASRFEELDSKVQGLSLSLADALAKNCGILLQQQLASERFMDALGWLVDDEETDDSVRLQTIQMCSHWLTLFEEAEGRQQIDKAMQVMERLHPDLVQLVHASHQPSSSSSNLGESISRAYDEDLSRAIALSLAISESEESGISSSVEIDNEVITPTLTPVDAIKVRALHDFSASGPEELSFSAGDIIHVLGAVYKQWYKGSLGDQTGIFPITHVEVIEEMPREVESDISEPPLSPENDDECKICFDGVPDHCLVPCGHAGMCETCSKAMRACPFCKKEVGQALKLWKI